MQKASIGNSGSSVAGKQDSDGQRRVGQEWDFLEGRGQSRLASEGKRPAGWAGLGREENSILEEGTLSHICRKKTVGGSEDAGEQWRLT